MSEERNSSTSRWLLGVLLLLLAGACVNMVVFLEDEGATVCDKLVASAERYPGDDTPCRVSKYDANGELRSVSRYVFEEGELRLAVFDRDADGHFEDEIDCSYWGRVQLPIVDMDEWSSLVSYGAARQGQVEIEYALVRRVDGVEGEGGGSLEYFESTSDWEGPKLRREDRLDSEGVLVERLYFRTGTEAPTRQLWMTYDSSGRLIEFDRATEMSPTATTTRLKYDGCEQVGE